ncbi:hypothetical protein BDW42DRAFT_169853 [Aspergillus taichungensis]|uniref:Uncharacterized protein n=1 Tax=Aspergillus taichungensis TaxID=482145 RepID=A0A2J5HV11_9EURO|nr:hypothetical protein BDW42DRAFT_169853 [Aspergillus taichungensis]
MELSLHMGTKLHTEFLSFYHWVKPLYYEQIDQADWVPRLQSFSRAGTFKIMQDCHD